QPTRTNGACRGVPPPGPAGTDWIEFSTPALRDRDRSQETRGNRSNLQACVGRLRPHAVFRPEREDQRCRSCGPAATCVRLGRLPVQHMAEVPMLVIPCISPRPDGHPTWIAACIWGSVLPAAWSFMLAARARGLAAAWTQIHPMFEEEVAAILGIPYADVV